MAESTPTTATQPVKETPSASRLAVVAGTAGLLAVATYTVIVAAPLDDVTAPFVASLFGPLLGGASIALYFVLASERPTFAGQLGAIANVAAGVLVTAMLLVQLALKEAVDENPVSPAIEDVFDHLHFGLDLAWDVFIAAGTILFACAMLGRPAVSAVGGAIGHRYRRCAVRGHCDGISDAAWERRPG